MSELFQSFLMECALPLLWMVAVAAVAAVPLVLLVISIDFTVGRWMAPRTRCLLWSIVILRLAMPIAPESPLSIQSVWQFVVASNPSVEQDQLQSQQGTMSPHQTIPEWAPASSPAATSSANAVAEPPTPIDWKLLAGFSLIAAWFLVAIAMLLHAIVSTIRFANLLRTVDTTDDQAIVASLNRVCLQLGVRRCPHVKFVPGLPAPAVFGVFTPTICLPEETRFQLSENQLRMILLHEVMHVRRRDTWFSWLLTVVQAAHWFNPLAWIAVRQIVKYRELACDEGVRCSITADDRKDYVELLLRFAGSRHPASLGLVGLRFSRPARQLTGRIKVFASEDLRRLMPRWAAAVVLALVVITGLTDLTSHADASRTLPENPTTVSEWMAQHPSYAHSQMASYEVPFEPSGPIETRDYDLRTALKKIAEMHPNADARKWLLSFLYPPFAAQAEVTEDDSDSSTVTVRMTQREHEHFADKLAALARSGPWQITVQPRVISLPHLELLGDLDWDEAVKFTPASSTRMPEWTQAVEPSSERRVTSGVDSTTRQFIPYLATVLKHEQVAGLTDRLQAHPRVNILNSLKVTLFNGQEGTIRDASYTPFVVGVHTVKGELGEAFQPEFAILDEGTTLTVRPTVINSDALDLQCRVILSGIAGVDAIKLPGMDVVVQSPKETKSIITARCTLSPGDALLLAPFVGKEADSFALCFLITAEWWPDEDPYGVSKKTNFQD